MDTANQHKLAINAATAASADTREVTLDTPIMRGENAISHFVMRKPVGGTLRGVNMGPLSQGSYDEVRKIIPRISDPVILATELDQMGAEDLMTITGELMDFLSSSAVKAAFQQTLMQ